MVEPSTPTLPQTGEETARELLAVTQADRDAAAPLMRDNVVTWKDEYVSRVLAGEYDDYPIVQAFARHRLSALTHPISREAVDRAAQYVLDNSRKGTSLNDEQRAADDDKLLDAYRDIITKALASGSLGRADESDLLLGQARFLLDRLNDFDDWSQDKDDLLHNWCGHVDPARSRLENTVAAMEAATPPSPCCLGVVEALEKIASGAARGLDDFKARMGGRKAPTWYAVRVLQDNLAACQGTARTALQSHRGEGR